MKPARPNLNIYQDSVNGFAIPFVDGAGEPFNLDVYSKIECVQFASLNRKNAVDEFEPIVTDNVLSYTWSSADTAEKFTRQGNVIEFRFFSGGDYTVLVVANVILGNAYQEASISEPTIAVTDGEATVILSDSATFAAIAQRAANDIKKIQAEFGILPNFISTETGTFPDSTGAVADTTKGAYFTEDGLFQIVLWDGDAWQDVGQPVSTKKYVDDKTSLFAESVTFQIGAGGHYDNPQQAIDALMRKRQDMASVQIILNLVEGYVWDTEIALKNGDYSHFEITSVDSEINVSAEYPHNSLMIGDNARMPVWNILVDMDGQGARALRIENCSSIVVKAGCGVKNAGGRGLALEFACFAMADGSIFTGAGDYGISAHRSSNITADGADVSGAGDRGVSASSNCNVNFEQGIADNCENAIVARFVSNIDATGASAKNANGNTIRAEGSSTVSFNNGDGSGCQNVTIRARNSTVSCEGANLQNSTTRGIDADDGSYIAAKGANANGGTGGTTIFARASRIDFRGGSADNCTGRAIAAERGGDISAAGATAKNCGGDRAVFAQVGSRIDADALDASDADGVGFAISAGSTINARSGIGSLSHTANTVTAAGIIFQ